MHILDEQWSNRNIKVIKIKAFVIKHGEVLITDYCALTVLNECFNIA